MARQRLGQHFLTDPSILKRIAEAACPIDAPVVLEIGPGRGALTEFLLRRARRVIAIELDPALAAHLKNRFPKLEVVQDDALQQDLLQWSPTAITGNLPYYVATPIISRVLRTGCPATFLIQKEVAERITSGPGRREYGYFSVECQLFADVDYLFTVKPGAFRPPPKVDSAAIRLAPREIKEVNDIEAFLKFVSLCFRQKRKMLRNNLSQQFMLIDELPEATLRAEQLTIAQFADIYRRLLMS